MQVEPGRRQTKILQGKLHLVCNGWVCCHDDKQSTPSARHTFRSWRIVWRGYTSFLSNSARLQADQGHACPTLLVRNWCCSRRCFPRQENVRKKNKKKRKEKHFCCLLQCKRTLSGSCCQATALRARRWSTYCCFLICSFEACGLLFRDSCLWFRPWQKHRKIAV